MKNNEQESRKDFLEDSSLCYKFFLRLAILASITVVICVLFSTIQRELFSVSLMSGFFYFVICAGVGAAFTFCGFFATYYIYEAAFL